MGNINGGEDIEGICLVRFRQSLRSFPTNRVECLTTPNLKSSNSELPSGTTQTCNVLVIRRL